jgi:polyisoprenoid-binding protein YceI
MKLTVKLTALVAGFVLATALRPCAAAQWQMETGGSRLDFAATFEKTPAPGIFKEFDTRLDFDPRKPDGGRLDVTIRIASADMASADINKAIAGPEWFDFARHPRATFQSTEIRLLEGNRYLARGTLSLKGVQRPVEVPFTWSGGADAATIEGEFTVQRNAFGIGTGEWIATNVIGPDVKVRFRVRLRRER